MRMKRVFAAGAVAAGADARISLRRRNTTPLPEIMGTGEGRMARKPTPTNTGGKRLWISTWRCTAGENAPVLKTKPAWYAVQPEKLDAGAEGRNEHGQIVIWHQNPADFVFGGRSSEKPLIVCHNYDRLALDTVYGAEYGARNTLRD